MTTKGLILGTNSIVVPGDIEEALKTAVVTKKRDIKFKLPPDGYRYILKNCLSEESPIQLHLREINFTDGKNLVDIPFTLSKENGGTWFIHGQLPKGLFGRLLTDVSEKKINQIIITNTLKNCIGITASTATAIQGTTQKQMGKALPEPTSQLDKNHSSPQAKKDSWKQVMVLHIKNLIEPENLSSATNEKSSFQGTLQLKFSEREAKVLFNYIHVSKSYTSIIVNICNNSSKGTFIHDRNGDWILTIKANRKVAQVFLMSLFTGDAGVGIFAQHGNQIELKSCKYTAPPKQSTRKPKTKVETPAKKSTVKGNTKSTQTTTGKKKKTANVKSAFDSRRYPREKVSAEWKSSRPSGLEMERPADYGGRRLSLDFCPFNDDS